MRIHRFVVVIGIILACTTCKKGEDKGGSGGGGTAGGGGGGGGAAAPGLELEDQAMEFKYSQFADSRPMVVKVKAKTPKGWKLMTEGPSLEMMHTYMPVKEGETPNLFTSSSVTISATCNGQCLAAKIPEQMAATAAQRLEMHGAGAKMVQDEEVRPGVRAFVVEFAGTKEGEKNYNVGVSMWLPGQDTAIFCEALLQGEQASLWQGVRDACLAIEIAAVDPLVGEEKAKQELANLANCPAETKVTHTPKEAKPEEDPVFTKIEAVRAEASQPGAVTVYLSSVPMTEREEFWNKELQAGQGVVNLSLNYNGQGEVLSGKYPGDGTGAVAISAGIRVVGGVTISVGGTAESWVEIVARTPDKICGRFNLQDNWRTLTGEFTADILPTR
jgi:hypothetical protein